MNVFFNNKKYYKKSCSNCYILENNNPKIITQNNHKNDFPNLNITNDKNNTVHFFPNLNITNDKT